MALNILNSPAPKNTLSNAIRGQSTSASTVVSALTSGGSGNRSNTSSGTTTSTFSLGQSVSVNVRTPTPSTSTSTSTFSAPDVKFNTDSFSKFSTDNFFKSSPDTPNPKLGFSLKAPTLPSVNIAAAVMNPSSLKNIKLKDVGKSMGIPTTVRGALTQAGLSATLPPVDQALRTLGLPTSARGLIQLSGLQFPQIPAFPGIDLIGINLGAGPKWIAEQIAKFKTIVPPFIPGLKINMGMALAAISVIRAALSTSPSELLKHLLNSIVDDLKSQVADQIQNAVDKSGLNNLQDQLTGVVGNAKISFTEQHDRNNPPEKITDENGETVEIPAPKPDLSGFPDVSNIAPKVGEGILASSTIEIKNFKNTPTISQPKAFTFPPTG